jgi:sRNA-binding carbon storage regulator CsrA
MLVLSRKVSESVVVDLEFFVTVTFLGDPAVEYSLSTLNRKHITTLTVRRNESITLGAGVRATVIRFEEDRVRLGFEIPPECRVDRAES